MSLDGIEVVRKYVATHNLGVRTGDFSQLISLFAADAEMVFEFGSLGSLRGREEIANAFRVHPPSDELVLGAPLDSGPELRFEYHWQSSPETRTGVLAFSLAENKIARLVISA